MYGGTVAGIQGQPLEITVVSCSKLKDTEWISRQDPYVCLEYATTKFRTRTCTDGGKNPVFQEKFVFPLIEGLRELNVVVWNSNTVTFDDFIGTGRVQLQKVLSQGFDDSAWPLQTKTGRYAGEVKLILHYANAQKSSSSHTPYMSTTPTVPLYNSAPSYYPQQQQQPHSNSAPYYHPPPSAAYPPSPYPAAAAASHSSPYPPPSSYAYPPSVSSPYPPPSSSPSPYPPPHSYLPSSAYPPSSYPPPAGYPPNAAGIYPPPPY
ncbi:hypothetical protein P8452_40404 [Trifolium repens]|nr:hypothetical protein P8452_40404 [Trifolium repens]